MQPNPGGPRISLKDGRRSSSVNLGIFTDPLTTREGIVFIRVCDSVDRVGRGRSAHEPPDPTHLSPSQVGDLFYTPGGWVNDPSIPLAR